MSDFLSGAIMMAYATSGLFFARFWVKTRERILGVFAIAFFLLATERWVLLLMQERTEEKSLIYLIRFLAFGLIIAGIIDKNRRGEAAGPRSRAEPNGEARSKNA